MRRFFNFFYRDLSGSMSTVVGVLAVPLMMFAGVAVDYSTLTLLKVQLQDAADSAALASTKELGLATTRDDSVRGIAENYVKSALAENAGIDGSEKSLKTGVTIASARNSVKVELAYVWKPLILQYVYKEALPLKVSATASLAGDEKICVIALDTSSTSSLAMTGASSMNANNCAVYSNSVDTAGISLVKGATLGSSNTYSSGGYKGPISSFSPIPVTDSPSISDPLLDRAVPKVGACDHTNFSTKSKTVTLNPGTYCGGISITGKTTINLKPGVYVMKDGPLLIGGNATLNGENVGFYFTGNNAVFNFGVSTQASLSAPKTGVMAGLLFFEDRSAPYDRTFLIRSKDAEKFEGTIYLSKGKFVIDKASRVGQQSKWTAIVVNSMEVRKGPQLEINSDYAASDIPVPDGVGASGALRLVR